MRWADFRKLRRRAADYTGQWEAHGREVWHGHACLGTMVSDEVARVVVDCHNHLLPLINHIVLTLAKRLDQETISEQEKQEA